MARRDLTANSDPNWTPAQRAGITDRSGSLAVSAAAGTGKTTVLTRRCVRLVIGDEPVDITRLLVVTFTEAAAREMRDRIRECLREQYDRNPLGRFTRQIALLDAAPICTLHAFCLQVVRENFATAGIEPDAGVLDEDEARLLKDDTLDELFESLYTSQDERGRQFARFVADYGQGRDNTVREQVVHLHEYLRSLPPPRREAWKQAALAAYVLDADGGLTPEHFAQLREAVLEEIDLLQEMGRIRLRAFEAQFGPSKAVDAGQAVCEYVEQLRASLEKVATQTALRQWVEQAGNVPWPRGIRWGEVPESCRKWAKWLYDTWKDSAGKRWVASAEAWAHGIGIAADYVDLLIWLVDRFDEGYARARQRIGRIDYSDMEEYAYRILAGDDGKPSEIARAFQHRYEHVLVDEFQDVNPIQAAILHLVSRESAEPPEPNLFVVGDVKQSIYGFRMTDPMLFDRRQEAVQAGKIAGRCISLQDNFRSRPEILAFVNRVFRKLLRKDETQVAYDALAELKPGREGYAPTDTPPIELHVLDGAKPPAGDDDQEAPAADKQDTPATDDVQEEELRDREKEAFLVASRIKEMLGQPYFDGKRTRPLTYRDMVILLRSTSTAAPVYNEVLRGMGIPVYAELRSGFFASREIQDMLCLLQVLENMRQDIPLAAVLRSPLLGEALCDADLADIRLARPAAEFCEAVRWYAESGPDDVLRKKVASRLDTLDRWRGEARLRPLAELVAEIYRQTGILEYVTLLPDGRQGRANLLGLYERARQFGQFSRQGLRRFVGFVTEMIQAGRESNAPTAVSEAQDVVRIMSTHASKGLEFPVVFLADLGRRFNDTDFQGAIVLDREGTLGMEARDPERMLRSDTLIKLLAAGRVRRQNRSEELRVLYVAMTRAKHRLVLVGTTRTRAGEWLEQERDLWKDYDGPLPRYLVRHAGCPLDWIVPALATPEAGIPSLFAWRDAEQPVAGRGTDPLAVFLYPAEATRTWRCAEQADRPDSRRVLAALVGGKMNASQRDSAAAAAIARLTAEYRFQRLTRIEAIKPVTELKGRLQWDDEDDQDNPAGKPPHRHAGGGFGIPRRLRPSTGGDAARQRGTATHLFMEKVDLAGPTDPANLQRQLEAMVESRLLSAVEAEQVDLAGAAWFFNETEPGRLIRKHRDQVYREMPFVMRLEPDRFLAGSGSDDLADASIVRGVIDVLWRTPEGVDIADFKTDAVGGQELHRRIALYQEQLDLYAEAIRRIWRQPVCRLWLAFLHARHIEPFTPRPLK